MSRMQRLVLFDVDLTLITATGCNLLALNSAFEQVHGIPGAFNDVVFGGGLDLPLMTEMYRKWGLTKGNPDELPDLSEFKAVYFDHLVRRLETWTDGYMCPGARNCWKRCHGSRGYNWVWRRGISGRRLSSSCVDLDWTLILKREDSGETG